MRGGAVKPVWHRRILGPGMERADAIGNDVEEYLHVLLVSGFDQFLIFAEAA